MNMIHHSGQVEVICGSMFSGKTEELIRRLRRAEIARQQVQVFKPSLDNRYAEEKVVSHNGRGLGALAVTSAAEILDVLDPEATVIGIDEAQFFDDGLPAVVDDLAGRGLRVVLAGLDMDFRGEPFGVMPALLARAEEVTKLRAICVVCGGAASRTQRLINGRPANYHDPVILVGAAEVYEARCREHHEVPR
ncbi:MAG: thymidine kinase [Anaerolineae bacterium]|nr:thymidine kinase [Anaerolineae bacterium]